MSDSSDWSQAVVDLVGKAVLAPSSHNTQPWIFLLNDPYVDLFADRDRSLRVNDPRDRELTISCGCALMNLVLAAADRTFHVESWLFPDADEPDWLARVALRPGGHRVPEADLARCIGSRRTCRAPYEARPVTPEAVAAMVDAARAEGCWLKPLLSEELRAGAAALVVAADSAQWKNPRWRKELAAWMHERGEGDGLSVSPLTAPVTQMIIRHFDMSRGIGAKDRQLVENSPLLAVIGTDGDSPRDWLAAGQALQRALLVGCGYGLQASYLNQPIQVPELRTEVRELVGGHGFPQICLRFGYTTTEIPASPRRPVEEVVVWS